MDDVSIADARLTRALWDLRRTNRLTGAYGATDSILDSLFRQSTSLRMLDVGCGGGDYLVHLARLAGRFNCRVELVGIDVNPVTVGHARSHLDDCLSPSLRPQVRVEVEDALSLSYEDNAFNIVHAALFLHHFHGERAVTVLAEMQRVARRGVLINDLHRHPVAYLGIWLLSRGLQMAPMVQHDGPMSVRRGFQKNELETLARKAQLPDPSIRWHWPFRWTLSTIAN